MQVLLLGGHGKVALHLTPLLLSRSWNVTSVIRNPAHEPEIRALHNKNQHKGSLSVLTSSLDEVQSEADARKVLDAVQPDCVVWSAGAGGKGGPARTRAIDQEAAKHFISAAFSDAAGSRVTKFLLVSHIGSRRVRPSWMGDEDWERVMNTNTKVLPAYAEAKLEADEFLTAHAARRQRNGGAPLQAICLRPGLLADTPATGKVQLGKIGAVGSVTREDVAIVADRLLARDDTQGWFDLLNGKEDVDEAVERVVKDKVDTVEGEDVDGMVKRFFP